MASKFRFAALGRYAAYTAMLVALCGLVTIGGCKRKIQVTGPVEFSEDEIKDMVTKVNGKKQRAGMGIDDVRIPMANRLAEVGPRAKEFGAIPALEKLAKDKDPKAKEAATKALQVIKGGS